MRWPNTHLASGRLSKSARAGFPSTSREAATALRSRRQRLELISRLNISTPWDQTWGSRDRVCRTARPILSHAVTKTHSREDISRAPASRPCRVLPCPGACQGWGVPSCRSRAEGSVPIGPAAGGQAASGSCGARPGGTALGGRDPFLGDNKIMIGVTSAGP
jgi:hypothetical protein